MESVTSQKGILDFSDVVQGELASCVERLKYAHFKPALTSAAAKLDEYYEKTTDSPVYIMAIHELLFCVLYAHQRSKRR